MTGLMVNGSVRSAGVTFYTRDGITIVRTSHSNQPHRRSSAQFDVRMRVRHNAALWQKLNSVDGTHFDGGKNAYNRFRSLAFSLPVVYIERNDSDTTLLLPGMPVSEGSLPSVGLSLGTIGGVPALITDISKDDLKYNETLLLYTVEQTFINDKPDLRVMVNELPVKTLSEVDGHIVLTGDEYGDNMKGWAIVITERKTETRVFPRCSTQTIVTNCTYYQRFTTEEAKNAAAESFGGLTK